MEYQSCEAIGITQRDGERSSAGARGWGWEWLLMWLGSPLGAPEALWN